MQHGLNNARPFLTVTPEYGPHPYSIYQPNTTIPFTYQWVVDQFIKRIGSGMG